LSWAAVEEVVNSADGTPFSLAKFEGIESTEDLFDLLPELSTLNLDLGDISIQGQRPAGKSLFSVEEIPEEYVTDIFTGYPFESAALLNQDSIGTYNIEIPMNEESIETNIDVEPSDNSQCNESVSFHQPSTPLIFHLSSYNYYLSSSSFCRKNHLTVKDSAGANLQNNPPNYRTVLPAPHALPVSKTGDPERL
jgi:hypothetical protein